MGQIWTLTWLIKNIIKKYGIDPWDNPSNVSRNFDIDIYGDVKITLHKNGTNIQFNTRVPT